MDASSCGRGSRTDFPSPRQQPSLDDVKLRLLYIQALEAARCLEEGVLTHPADGDLGSILGWGFPSWTGGVLSLIDTVGAARFVVDCERLAERYGPRFRPPCDSLKDMARAGKKLHAAAYSCRRADATQPRVLTVVALPAAAAADALAALKVVEARWHRPWALCGHAARRSRRRGHRASNASAWMTRRAVRSRRCAIVARFTLDLKKPDSRRSAVAARRAQRCPARGLSPRRGRAPGYRPRGVQQAAIRAWSMRASRAGASRDRSRTHARATTSTTSR
jgi:hypothetical protein